MNKISETAAMAIVAGSVALAVTGFLPSSVSGVANAWARWQTSRVVRAEWSALVAGSRLSGELAAEVVVVEFGDYQCPGCREADSILQDAMARSSGHRGVVFRHVPARSHAHAEAAALASICSEAQGAFPTMHRILFAIPDWNNEPDWTALAEAAGIPDLVGFVDCLTGSDARERLERDVQTAMRLGVRGTPTFVTKWAVNEGRPPQGWFDEVLNHP